MAIPFLCIGAQKSGTTWLYEALRRHPSVWLPAIKELQYFNEIYVPEGHHRLRVKHLMQSAERYLATLHTPPYRPYGPETSSAYTEFRDLCEFFTIRTDDDYRDFFLRNAGDAVAFGEMTPEYAMLPADGFRRIQSVFPDVRLLFILRDPVERYWSQLRMVAARQGGNAYTQADMTSLPSRSNYPMTIRNVRAADAKHFKIVLYEDLLADPARHLPDVLSFMGLGPTIPETMRPVLNTVVHAGDGHDMPPEFVEPARALMRPVYEFVAEETDLDVKKWRYSSA